VVVHGSIGSGGGMRALAGGVTDIGLAASPASDLRQAPEGFVMVPVALAAVAIVVHPSVPDRAFTIEGAAAALSGQRRAWSDGSLVVPLLREEGDSATHEAERALPELGPALEEARAAGRFRTLITDLDMGSALEETPGGVGLYDAGALHLEDRSLEAASIQGVLPTREALAAGTYPMRRVLLFAVSESPRPAAASFVDFVLSEEGRRVIDGAGYVPLDGEAP
jgi:phosphate transport system substrate-binding protein